MSEFKIGRMKIIIPRAISIMAVVVVIVMGIASSRLHTEVKNHEVVINDLRDRLNLADEAKNQAEADYLTYKDKYDMLMDKVWHNGADLAGYIESEYPKIPIEVATIIADSINSAIGIYPMDFSLVVGMIEVESRFNPMAVSKKGATGLMQIMPNIWAESLGIENEEDLYDIETNILCGVRVFLHNLKTSKGNIGEALWRYNGVNGKKGEFADLVYKAVGRFETFRAMRNGDYESDEQIETLSN
ncbi:hypothetical protein DRN34_01780 [Thermococci archaeon]|nr:MAG: hypothetical protein DRN34_01780 [Thermococci archaeon]